MCMAALWVRTEFTHSAARIISSRDNLRRQYGRDDNAGTAAVVFVKQVGLLRPEQHGVVDIHEELAAASGREFRHKLPRRIVLAASALFDGFLRRRRGGTGNPAVGLRRRSAILQRHIRKRLIGLERILEVAL